MHRTTITLPDHLAELVRREAHRRRSSVSEVIRRLVADALAGSEQQPRPIPWAGVVDDPGMVPAARMDEALATEWADAIDRDRG